MSVVRWHNVCECCVSRYDMDMNAAILHSGNRGMESWWQGSIQYKLWTNQESVSDVK